MNVYTMQQWRQDKQFNAVPGQEITSEVYKELLNCMPPKSLPGITARRAHDKYNIPVHDGFLMGEPASSNDSGALYHAFAMNDFGNSQHYFYIGLSNAEAALNGTYYFFDCLNAFDNDGYFRSEEFEDEKEAIAKAADYEAALYREVYEGGNMIASALLYDPYECFEIKEGKNENN